MNISTAFLQICIILLPGIIWAKIDKEYVLKYKPSYNEFLFRSLIFSFISYTLEFIFIRIIQLSDIYTEFDFTIFDVGKINQKNVLNFHTVVEIFIAIIFSVLCSIVWLKSNKYLTRFLIKHNVTKRYGCEDVWDYILHSKGETYVRVWDYTNKLVFSGCIISFSETDKVRELMLRDVTIYDLNCVEIFITAELYISRPSDAIVLEFPACEENS
ncbi:hypothetical protein [Aristophania vespae]|uniref:hypothetical protein n=1 Tax=Aristophania vespae TaxID=2697033 RepID=UPI002351A24F|nr:hypothetical protein [Aristophania vespae]UMM64711.1 hypothetical protein DM15PD_17300 [Aristophania vespae]